ncbi:MAG: hypothetical protein ACLFR1_13055 [Spirochaetia bacterium]
MKKTIHYLFLFTACIVLASCGGYYSGEVAGYIVDSENDAGINDAVVRFYREEPESADADTYFIETASMTSGGNDGYFSHRIIWENWNPQFGPDDDSGTVWLGITHDDYVATVERVDGVLSNTLNIVPTISMQRDYFSVEEITGRIVDKNGNGVNGVTVVIDVPSTEENEADYTANTGTDEEGIQGVFVFTNVEWNDEEPEGNADGEGDQETLYLYLDDNNYQILDSEGETQMIEVPVVSDVDADLGEKEVSRYGFTVPSVTGRVMNNGQPVNGVRVVLDLSSTDENTEDYVVTTQTVDGDVGTYQFNNIRWEDQAPDNDPTDTENIVIRVDDGEYQDADTGTLTVTSDDDYTVSSSIEITRIPTTEFSSVLRGRCVDRRVVNGETQDTPLEGVEVKAEFTRDDEDTRTLIGYTNADGYFEMDIMWVDTNPGDYDEGGSNTGTPDPEIPEAEDGLVVTMTYPTAAELGYDEGSEIVPGSIDLKSWLENTIGTAVYEPAP